METSLQYEQLLKTLNDKGVKLLAVSKTHAPEQILSVYQKGQRRFGENRVQEMLSKVDALPSDIEWHLIGHLQTNKVKFIAPFVHTIQSVDSLRLLEEVEKQAAKNQRTIRCLLQFHIAEEETKFGFSLEEAKEMLAQHPPAQFPHVVFAGVMGMATFTDDESTVKREFDHLRHIFSQLKAHFFAAYADFSEISMGMSGDWPLAVEAGSTMVRIGSLIFGPRS